MGFREQRGDDDAQEHAGHVQRQPALRDGVEEVCGDEPLGKRPAEAGTAALRGQGGDQRRGRDGDEAAPGPSRTNRKVLCVPMG